MLASQYGRQQNNDLMLIRLAAPAPSAWTVQPIAPPPGRAAGAVATDEFPQLDVLGFGDSVDDETRYSAGVLGRLRLQAISPVSSATFLTMVLDKQAGTCSGDSGAAAIVAGGRGADARRGVVGVLSSNSLPCTGSNGLFVSPAAFADFLRKGAADLNLPPPAGL